MFQEDLGDSQDEEVKDNSTLEIVDDEVVLSDELEGVDGMADREKPGNA